jgi:hypothetical protein
LRTREVNGLVHLNAVATGDVGQESVLSLPQKREERQQTVHGLLVGSTPLLALRWASLYSHASKRERERERWEWGWDEIDETMRERERESAMGGWEFTSREKMRERERMIDNTMKESMREREIPGPRVGSVFSLAEREMKKPKGITHTQHTKKERISPKS